MAAALVAASGCVASARPYVTAIHPGVTATAGVVYGQSVDRDGDLVDLRLDVVEPAGDRSTGRPAVIVVHGGGFTTGNRGEIRFLADDLAKRGYVAVTIDYRLRRGEYFSLASPTPSAAGAITDARHDAQTAVRWLKANAASYRVDPTKVAIAGYSAGAITALGVAFRSDDPGDGGWGNQSSRVCTAVSLSGMAAEGGIDPSDPPVTLLHGTADEIVPFALAQVTAAATAANGRPANVVVYPGVGHLVIIDQRAKRYRDDIAQALATALTNGPCS